MGGCIRATGDMASHERYASKSGIAPALQLSATRHCNEWTFESSSPVHQPIDAIDAEPIRARHCELE